MSYSDSTPVKKFFFVGVTTGKSSINAVFPLWMQLLGRQDVELIGIDHPIHDQPAAYRATVARIADDPHALGALVTTHKLDLFAAAEDMFDYFDPYAETTREISCISKRNGRLEGHAKDPITAGLSLHHIIGDGYFGRTGGHVLCLGAGGAALSMLLHLLNRQDAADRPARFTAVDRSAERLAHMRAMAGRYATDIALVTVCNADSQQNAALLAAQPAGSVVINATGMGKDTPGSPLTDEAVFPRHAVAWDFNYRGALDFLHQARRQAAARDLTVADGWVYFLHGWSQVIGQVLDVAITPALFAQLDTAAATTR